MPPKQGEIYWIDIDQAGLHPFIIASADHLNLDRTVLAIPFTTQNLDERKLLATCACFELGSCPGLDRECVAQAEMLDRIVGTYLDRPTARLDSSYLNRVLTAIANVFEIPTYLETD